LEQLIPLVGKIGSSPANAAAKNEEDEPISPVPPVSRFIGNLLASNPVAWKVPPLLMVEALVPEPITLPEKRTSRPPFLTVVPNAVPPPPTLNTPPLLTTARISVPPEKTPSWESLRDVSSSGLLGHQVS
jgi:hypothetical protein